MNEISNGTEFRFHEHKLLLQSYSHYIEITYHIEECLE